MIDFAAARRMMVDGQVRTSDVTDHRIIAAMLELPRERFVAAASAGLCYGDFDVPVAPAPAPGRRLLKPMVLAKMVQAAQVGATDRVLVVGCASGYSSALLARLAAFVVALEEDPDLAKLAASNLTELAGDKATVVTGPLTRGWPPQAPYDVIFLNGASEIEPHTLFAQLKDQGRLVAVIGRAPSCRAMLYRLIGADASAWPVFDAAAQVLPGFAAPPQFVF
jgi:protein-L-isoaspartate(D-aspartate) O-methyltransferase